MFDVKSIVIEKHLISIFIVHKDWNKTYFLLHCILLQLPFCVQSRSICADGTTTVCWHIQIYERSNSESSRVSKCSTDDWLWFSWKPQEQNDNAWKMCLTFYACLPGKKEEKKTTCFKLVLGKTTRWQRSMWLKQPQPQQPDTELPPGVSWWLHWHWPKLNLQVFNGPEVRSAAMPSHPLPSQKNRGHYLHLKHRLPVCHCEYK